MSEYQYYEFLALDRPLTAEQQATIRTLSSRVRPTSSQAIFTYSYGDFRGDPLTVLAEHFDVMLYLANWGSKQLAFRLPRAAVEPDDLQPYVFGADEIEMTTSPDQIILSLNFFEEEGLGWIEPEGTLSTLAPLRAALLRGDRRVLYLAWLKSAAAHAGWTSAAGSHAVYEDDDEDNDWDEDGVTAEDRVVAGDDEATPPPDRLVEPPVPPGLGQLDGAHMAFVSLFEIDADLIAVAAATSPPLAASDEPYERWVTLLPVAERDAFLVRMARDEPQAGEALRRRLRVVVGASAGPAADAGTRRSLATLLTAATAIREVRREAERVTAEAARRRHLHEVARQEPALWELVDDLIEQKTARAYDEAVVTLVDLQALADDRDQMEPFAERITALRHSYARRSTLIQRLDRAGLT